MSKKIFHALTLFSTLMISTSCFAAGTDDYDVVIANATGKEFQALLTNERVGYVFKTTIKSTNLTTLGRILNNTGDPHSVGWSKVEILDGNKEIFSAEIGKDYCGSVHGGGYNFTNIIAPFPYNTYIYDSVNYCNTTQALPGKFTIVIVDSSN